MSAPERDTNCPGQDVPVDGGTHPNNPQSPRRLTAAQRRAQVMEYKLLDASVRQIVEKLGMGHTKVHQIICEELQKQTEHPDGHRAVPAASSEPA